MPGRRSDGGGGGDGMAAVAAMAVAAEWRRRHMANAMAAEAPEWVGGWVLACICVRAHLCACVRCACMRARARGVRAPRACVRGAAHVCVCACACAHVFVWCACTFLRGRERGLSVERTVRERTCACVCARAFVCARV